ncbi:hypothetical protein GCM10027261_41060 [Geodermatophilus arenarius]|uniref:Uncharacterized protein n=1 Tax=Geodermatophilus arenarius TaxID=1137990 RepID=A0ABV9LJ85_9ACTN
MDILTASTAGRVRQAVTRYWQAQVHLWEVYLSPAGWDPAPGDEALHWVGRRLVGSVLPDEPR